MRRNHILILAFMFCSLFFVACSEDDDNENINSVDYMPLNVGNTWIYSNWVLDAQNSRMGEATLDTAIIEKAEELYQYTGYKYHHSSESEAVPHTYFRNEANVIYASESFFKSPDLSAINSKLNNLSFSNGWYVMANFGIDKPWQVAYLSNSSTINHVTFAYTYSIVGQVGKSSTATIAGKTYSTKDIDLKYYIQASATGLGTIINDSLETKLTLAKGVGICKQYMPSKTINVPLIGNITINGFEKVLNSFLIVPNNLASK